VDQSGNPLPGVYYKSQISDGSPIKAQSAGIGIFAAQKSFTRYEYSDALCTQPAGGSQYFQQGT